MKRSEINQVIKESTKFFGKHGWVLPPQPRWDVTDFGLGDFKRYGLVLINLTEEPEYCEKLMYAIKGQTTPKHYHKKKKEDIICRKGILIIQVWTSEFDSEKGLETVKIKVNGINKEFNSGDKIRIESGERVTMFQEIWHEFYPETDQCIIAEVSTANDDVHDNFFENKEIGRYSDIEEDDPAILNLLSD